MAMRALDVERDMQQAFVSGDVDRDGELSFDEVSLLPCYPAALTPCCPDALT